jgi:hypothetical protein
MRPATYPGATAGYRGDTTRYRGPQPATGGTRPATRGPRPATGGTRPATRDHDPLPGGHGPLPRGHGPLPGATARYHSDRARKTVRAAAGTASRAHLAEARHGLDANQPRRAGQHGRLRDEVGEREDRAALLRAVRVCVRARAHVCVCLCCVRVFLLL